VEIPRPLDDSPVAGQGYIFVEFADVGGATKAQKALDGRMFDSNAVDASYYPPELFHDRVRA
jgi:splicing factor U2AF 65 kDa subunit